MTKPDLIANFCFRPSSDVVARSGRLGTLAFNLGVLRLDGVQLRRSATGRTYLSFRYAEVRPATDGGRRWLEAQVLAALGFKLEEAGP